MSSFYRVSRHTLFGGERYYTVSGWERFFSSIDGAKNCAETEANHWKDTEEYWVSDFRLDENGEYIQGNLRVFYRWDKGWLVWTEREGNWPVSLIATPLTDTPAGISTGPSTGTTPSAS